MRGGLLVLQIWIEAWGPEGRSEGRSKVLCYNIPLICARTFSAACSLTVYRRPPMTHDHSSASSDISARLSTAEALCHQRGKRLTPIRRKVLEILLAEQRSLKAYELLDLIRDVQQGAAPPTVYRALDFLVDEGLVHRLDAINAWTACQDAGGAPHDLLVICTQCGTVAELSDPALGRQLANKVAEAGFILAGQETELRALCQKCRKHASLGACLL